MSTEDSTGKHLTGYSHGNLSSCRKQNTGTALSHEFPEKSKYNHLKLRLSQSFIRALFVICVIIICTHNIAAQPNVTVPWDQKQKNVTTENDDREVVGCDHLDIADVWIVQKPKLLTESAFRMIDLNEDGVLDIVFGFATEISSQPPCSVQCPAKGADGQEIPEVVCDIYFSGARPCFGGLMALEGKTGEELWRYWSEHELYGINCNADLNSDGVNDCLAAGRGGQFHAVNGRNGTQLWYFGEQEAKNKVMNVYTPQITKDLDNDGIVDLIVIHGGDPLQGPGSDFRLSGRILVMSGKTGKVLRWSGFPDEKESYYSPQIYRVKNGTEMVLFGTGGETHNGSLWTISLGDLYKGAIDKSVRIYGCKEKGVMDRPVLLDLTGDGVVDIVMSLFDTTVIAVDGQTYEVLWNYTFPSSETYVSPAPGYFNNDTVPDFIVKYNYGPGYPVYYHAETTVLDGRNGQPIVRPFLKDTIGSQASSLTISMEGYGNDIFLYWLADCLGHKGEGGEFSFVNGTAQSSKTRANLCQLRYKSKGYSKIKAMGGNIRPPGQEIYYSENRKHVEHSAWINTTQEAIDFVKSHPNYQEDYNRYKIPSPGVEEDSGEKVQRQLTRDYHRINRLLQSVIKKLNQERRNYSPYLHRKTNNENRRHEKLYRRKRVRKYKKLRSGREDYSYHEMLKNLYNPRDEIIEKYLKRKSRKQDRSFHHERYRWSSFLDSEEEPISKNSPVRNRFRKKFENLQNLRSLNHFDKRLDNGDNLELYRRHIGPHDNNGLQRLISTGTLAPPTLPTDHKDYNHSIDYIFGVYWFFPMKTQAILPGDQKCIANKMAEETIRFDKNSKYHGMDHDAYEHAITDECLTKNGNTVKNSTNERHDTDYNPYELKMGQLTVYRMRLTCRCSRSRTHDQNRRCARVFPYDQQQWPAYMGRHADCLWLPRQQKNND